VRAAPAWRLGQLLQRQQQNRPGLCRAGSSSIAGGQLLQLRRLR
jgi:hypothetical protein